LAYGYPRRVEAKIERYGEKTTIRTPKGKVSAKEYVRRQTKKIDRETEQLTSAIPNLTVKLNRNLTWSNKGLDVFYFEIHEVFTENNYYDKLKRTKDYIRRNITPLIGQILSTRRPLYDQGEHVIGVKLNFKTTGMHTYRSEYDEYGERILTDEEVVIHEFHMTVVYRETFRSMNELEDDVFHSLEQGASKVFDYKNISVTLDSIEVGIITRQSMNAVEKLRVR
jgi:hypothetical protein